jgi:hypothetical protein
MRNRNRAGDLPALSGDDIYVLRSLRADDWGHRLFAFDFDAPSADDVSWWSGATFQRRFVRVPSSALLWVQWKLFGFHGEAFHAVTWLFVLASALLIHRRARQSLPPCIPCWWHWCRRFRKSLAP